MGYLNLGENLFNEGKYKEAILMYDEAFSKHADPDLSSIANIEKIAELYANVEVNLPNDETLIKLGDLVRKYILNKEGIELARHIYSHVKGELPYDAEDWINVIDSVDY